jgi:hypothetical protein
MLDLEYELKGMCRRNQDGSRMTQAQRERRLRRVARELHSLGYRNLHASSLKPKHVQALVKQWQEQELSPGTIKNRLADLRWWAEKAGHSGSRQRALRDRAKGLRRRSLQGPDDLAGTA